MYFSFKKNYRLLEKMYSFIKLRETACECSERICKHGATGWVESVENAHGIFMEINTFQVEMIISGAARKLC